MVGNCGNSESVRVACDLERPESGPGAGLGDRLAIAEGRDVEKKGSVLETGVIQGFSGQQIDSHTIEVTGAVGCGADRLESRTAQVWECRY